MELIERARGMMVGTGVGNLLGIPWEFNIRALRHEQCEHGAVREIVAKKGYLDDDDLAQAILLAEAIADSGDRDLEVADLAERFWRWGEINGAGMGGLTHAVLTLYGGSEPLSIWMNSRRFWDPSVTAPREPRGVAADEAARLHWEESGGESAGNGSVMRCGPVALRWMHDEQALARNSVTSAVVTHWDARCVWSTLLADFTIADCLRTGQVEAATLIERCSEALHSTRGSLAHPDLPAEPPDDVSAAAEAAFAGNANIYDLKLDCNGIGYAPKAMSAVLWAARHARSVEDGLVTILNAGGDTDSNAPPAGAALGARFGLSGIPSRWRERTAEIRSWKPNTDVLDDQVAWPERRPLEEYADRIVGMLAP
ncbi:MAG: ADP-ribosylglycohydrolase family protein [Acidimicrobiaceae bacterium]|nr:ADP-ribosylglycohydrolase family protein [Acidimicrobiaceae bacterium]